MFKLLFSVTILMISIVAYSASKPTTNNELIFKIAVDTTDLQSCINSGVDSFKEATFEFDIDSAESVLSTYCQKLLTKITIENRKMEDFLAPGQKTRNPPVEINLDLSGFLNTGNDTTFYADAKLGLAKRMGRHKVAVNAAIERKGEKDKKTLEKMAIVFKDDIQIINNKWVVFANATILKDEPKGEKLRHEENLGIAYEFADKGYNDTGDSFKYGVSMGNKYIENFEAKQDRDAIFSQNVSFSQTLSNNVSIKGVIVLKNNVQDLKDFEVVSDIALKMKKAFLDSVSFSIGVKTNYVSQPIAGKDSQDVKYYMEIGWTPEIKKSLF